MDANRPRAIAFDEGGMTHDMRHAAGSYRGGEGTLNAMRRLSSLAGIVHAGAVALVLSLTVAAASQAAEMRASGTLEERKLPMHFIWHGQASERSDRTCAAGCRTWVSAVGLITGDTPAEFADFAADHDLHGVTMVLDSSGGSVLDAIKLGRLWRELGVRTMVGTVSATRSGGTTRVEIYPEAYCESMCVFLLLSGNARTVPAGAHVRVHQIWMGDRAEDATAANYSAQDVMIIERDVGRLAKYTFEMGGSGDLLGIALSIPPWEPLHELSPAELRLTNLVTPESVVDAVADASVLRSGEKPVQDRFVAGDAAASRKTKTAEAIAAEPEAAGQH